MLTRRNIRIKVFQLLYELHTKDEKVMHPSHLKELDKKIKESKDLFVFIILFMHDVCSYAKADALYKRNKYLPSAEDLKVDTKIASISTIASWMNNNSFFLYVKEYQKNIEQDWIIHTYQALIASDQYQAFIALDKPSLKDEQTILQALFYNYILANDHFISYVEELFVNVQNDIDGLVQMVDSFILSPHQEIDNYITDDKIAFANTLFEMTIEKDEYYLSIIKPKLVNWELDRIPIIDTIFIKMAICEFLFFDTIPIRVTINEYIELSKEYSTQASSQFINGILDNIYKDFLKDKLIRKVDYLHSNSSITEE